MGELRIVPKVAQFKFESISVSPDSGDAGKLFRKKDGHPPNVRLGRYAVEEVKICTCGHERKCIGAEASEVLEWVPAHCYICEYGRNKYACQYPDCYLVLEGKPGSVLFVGQF